MNFWSHMSWTWAWWVLIAAAVVAVVWIVAARSNRSERTRESTRQVTDPICGMQFSIEKAVSSFEYLGKTYYFCAEACRREFESDPEKYA